MVHRLISSTSTVFNDKHSDFNFQMFLFALIKSTMVAFLVEILHRHYKPCQVLIDLRPN